MDSKIEQELITKTNLLSLNPLTSEQDLADGEATPNRGRFFSSMNYHEPQQGESISDNNFLLDIEEELPQIRGYSLSLPMRPISMSQSSSVKSGFDSRTIEEEDEYAAQNSDQEIPIFSIDQLPKNHQVVDTILQSNECIRNRSQSENFSNQSIFNFCSSVRSKRNTVIQ